MCGCTGVPLTHTSPPKGFRALRPNPPTVGVPIKVPSQTQTRSPVLESRSPPARPAPPPLSFWYLLWSGPASAVAVAWPSLSDAKKFEAIMEHVCDELHMHYTDALSEFAILPEMNG